VALTNPLLALFSAQAQQDAGPARAHLAEVAAKRRAAAPTTAANKAVVKPVRSVEHARSARAAKVVAATKPFVPKLARAKPRSVPALAAQHAKTVPAGIKTSARLPTDVVVYDVGAGIKTMHRATGTVEEEPFDPATLPAIKAAEQGRAQIKIVNEANPVSTGSTGIVQPQSPAAIKAGPR
jgi:hypothetical protein